MSYFVCQCPLLRNLSILVRVKSPIWDQEIVSSGIRPFKLSMSRRESSTDLILYLVCECTLLSSRSHGFLVEVIGLTKVKSRKPCKDISRQEAWTDSTFGLQMYLIKCNKSIVLFLVEVKNHSGATAVNECKTYSEHGILRRVGQTDLILGVCR